MTIKIVPKGLRAFDEHDADFFLELLPGPRDRDGLPESLRFWKTRIEEADADKTFTVGLIYGPSGCGKSSLVQAGLLPRLSENVNAVYVEATPGETETRLLGGLRKRCPGLPTDLDLKQTLAALRRGQGVPAGQKVLIVLDQFEQWLHANKAGENPELVQALRQCDGGRVQCIVMVRDDFWLAVSRFMLDLEVDLVPGRNIALVDLFDLDHARKILAAFGRAFGRLPENRGETSREQKDFLEQAVDGPGGRRQGRLRPPGPVRRDDEEQALDARRAQGSGRNQGDRRHLPGRDLQRADRESQSTAGTRRRPAPSSKLCSPNRARTSRGTCVPTRSCSRHPATPAAPGTSTS